MMFYRAILYLIAIVFNLTISWNIWHLKKNKILQFHRQSCGSFILCIKHLIGLFGGLRSLVPTCVIWSTHKLKPKRQRFDTSLCNEICIFKKKSAYMLLVSIPMPLQMEPMIKDSLNMYQFIYGIIFFKYYYYLYSILCYKNASYNRK